MPIDAPHNDAPGWSGSLDAAPLFEMAIFPDPQAVRDRPGSGFAGAFDQGKRASADGPRMELARRDQSGIMGFRQGASRLSKGRDVSGTVSHARRGGR